MVHTEYYIEVFDYSRESDSHLHLRRRAFVVDGLVGGDVGDKRDGALEEGVYLGEAHVDERHLAAVVEQLQPSHDARYGRHGDVAEREAGLGTKKDVREVRYGVAVLRCQVAVSQCPRCRKFLSVLIFCVSLSRISYLL